MTKIAKLYIVPTPIGNLEDITLRALRILSEVDLILAEDTRTSSILLHHYKINTPMQSHHAFNEHKSVEAIAKKIEDGCTVALISDAGTPGISDPGFLLVRTCIERGILVECLPGATAFVPALVNSGFPSDSFLFEGFLPVKKGRQKKFKIFSEEHRTAIFYESPYRLVKTLLDLSQFLGPDRQACVCRELSKKFEENRRGRLEDLAKWYQEHPPKGEIVLVVSGTT
ncbi:MAG: 16S rRNA (cytidine(1402)-2'-O)-methyltransferase [Prevotellaceae bacterium]|jgi:16S rRNA (cytidine1402-2'-O)-methyltransferase|nr:16S rRNA (cytidine(1402)-2'-O)-methyltransferase [Prevotellaceae bacterium]